jgi:N-acetylmuramic acid 6-phosphate (MurNAc-6-P) etherase
MQDALPITERSNDLTTSLDMQDPLGIVRLLRGCDGQLFSGYQSFPGLTDKSIFSSMQFVSTKTAEIIRSDNGVVVMSGSGTSGRIAFLVARDMNRVLVNAGKRPCFKYLCSGGDAALLLSDELPEDDTITAVKDLLLVTSEQSEKDEVLVIGITCGMSAPYVAGQLDYALDMCENTWNNAIVKAPDSPPKYTCALVGFNPVVFSRPNPIEMWSSRPENLSKTMFDVVQRLQKASFSKKRNLRDEPVQTHAILNPVVGPEAVCASSRMKGGSATLIILTACFGPAVAAATQQTRKLSIANVLDGMEKAYQRTYLVAKEISKILEMCGESIKNGGHVYWLGEGSAGILGFVDASEMPDTYGAAFTEFRGFCDKGWSGIQTVEGDLSDRGSLYRISLEQFEDDIFPNLTACDTVIGLYAHALDCHCPNRAIEELLLKIATEKQSVSTARVVCGPTHQENAHAVNMNCFVELPSTEAAFLNDYAAYSQFSLKLVLNAISTGAQIMKGMVCQNHMINTGPTNNKIYHRCIRLIMEFANVGEEVATQALWKAIYEVNDLSAAPGDAPVQDRPLSDHIRAATPAEDDASRGQDQTILPLAILIGSGMTVESSKAALVEHKIVRKAINASIGKSA